MKLVGWLFKLLAGNKLHEASRVLLAGNKQHGASGVAL